MSTWFLTLRNKDWTPFIRYFFKLCISTNILKSKEEEAIRYKRSPYYNRQRYR